MNNDKFETLSACEKKIDKIYLEALDFSLSNENNRNIAITGSYGTGKSTLWNSYSKVRKIQSINVSLGTYIDGIEKEEKKDVEKELYRIEEQIINHISAQIKRKKIPLSKYKFKANQLDNEFYSEVAGASALFLLLFSLNYFEKTSFMYMVIVIILAITFCYIIIRIIRNNKVDISKIKLHGAEFAMKKHGKSSVFDRDLSEIIYLIKSSDVKVFVFEDLDRFKDSRILNKLRELNILANANIEIDEVIRFIYMIDEKLFEAEVKTKFFDFIIPVLPVMNNENSGNELNILLDKETIKNKPNERTLQDLSLFVNDMRLLKNIVNEYIIWSDENLIKVEALGLDENKLLAMIFLKNIIPLEYTMLQSEEGIIYNILNNIENHKTERQKQINDEINNIDQKLNVDIGKKFLEYSADIPADVHIMHEKRSFYEVLNEWSKKKEEKKRIVSSNNYTFFNDFDTFISEFVSEETIEDWKSKEIEYPAVAEENKKKLRIDYEKISTYKTKRILSEMPDDSVEKLFNDIFNKQTEIKESKELKFIKFLILEGLINENYKSYIGYFKPGTIGINDKRFLLNNTVRENTDPFLSIENPNLVFERLKSAQFSNPCILNSRLFTYCLEKEEKVTILDMTFALCKYRIDDFASVLSRLDFNMTNIFVEYLIFPYVDILPQILAQTNNAKLKSSILLAVYSLKDIKKTQLEPFNKDMGECVEIFTRVQSNEQDVEMLYKNIIESGVKFIDIEVGGMKISRESISFIEKNDVYIPTLKNFSAISKAIVINSNSDFVTEIYENEQLSQSKKNLKQYLVIISKEYINNYTNLSCNQEFLVDILNCELDAEIVEKYISKSIVVLNDLKDINEERIEDGTMGMLFKKNKVKFTVENIPAYQELGTISDLNLAQYFNANENEFNFEFAKKLFSKNRTLSNELIIDKNLSQRNFEVILQDSNCDSIVLDNVLEKDRMEQIISEEKLQVNLSNSTLLIKSNLIQLLCKWLNNNQKKEEELKNFIIANIDNINPIQMTTLIEEIIDQNIIIDIMKSSVEEITLEKVDFSKEKVIEYIIENKASLENNKYIINRFESFPLKEEFVSYLTKDTTFDFIMPLYFSEFAIKNVNLDSEIKINVLFSNIQKGFCIDKVGKWLSCIQEVDSISEIFNNNKRPKERDFESNLQKEVISKLKEFCLISISKEGRIYKKNAK